MGGRLHDRLHLGRFGPGPGLGRVGLLGREGLAGGAGSLVVRQGVPGSAQHRHGQYSQPKVTRSVEVVTHRRRIWVKPAAVGDAVRGSAVPPAHRRTKAVSGRLTTQ